MVDSEPMWMVRWWRAYGWRLPVVPPAPTEVVIGRDRENGVDCAACGRYRPSSEVSPLRDADGRMVMACARCRRAARRHDAIRIAATSGGSAADMLGWAQRAMTLELDDPALDPAIWQG